MKKLICLLFVLCLTFLAGCEGIFLSSNSDNSSLTSQVSQEKISEFTVSFDYGFHVQDANGNKKIATLFNGGKFSFSYDSPTKKLIVGDRAILKYTGEIIIQESYPSIINITGGSLISIDYFYTTTFKVEDSNILRNEYGYVTKINDQNASEIYIILNEDFDFVKMSEYKGEEIFASKNYLAKLDTDCMNSENTENTEYKITDEYKVGAYFAYNPRP